MSRRRQRGSKVSRKGSMRIEAAVMFMDGICKRTDWVGLRGSDKDRDLRVSEMLSDFMRSRMYMLDPSLECSFMNKEELEFKRSSLIGMGRRCLELCRAYGLHRTEVEEAVCRAMDEYEAVLDLAQVRGGGFMVRRLVDRVTGESLYDAKRDKRRPLHYDPLSWLLMGIKEGCVSAYRMPADIPDDEVDRYIPTLSTDQETQTE